MVKKYQLKGTNKLRDFLKSKGSGLFLLEGEAGSGKTYITSLVVNRNLRKNYKFFICAPTNSAKNTLKETIKGNLDNETKDYIKQIEFKTIHSFFKSRSVYDSTGKQHFELDGEDSILHYIHNTRKNTIEKEEVNISKHKIINLLSKNKLTEFCKSNKLTSQLEEKYYQNFYNKFSLNTLFINGKIDEEKEEINKRINKRINDIMYVIFIDESSMIDFEKYSLFYNLIYKFNIKIIFIGDRNQLSYIKENKSNEKQIKEYISYLFKNQKIITKVNNFLYYKEYISPVFNLIKERTLIKGNSRVDNTKIRDITNRAKNCVITGNRFKLKKKDYSPEIKKGKFNQSLIKKIIKKYKNGKSTKIITYTNKRKDYLNTELRKVMYKYNKNYHRYLYLEGEQLIFKSSYNYKYLIEIDDLKYFRFSNYNLIENYYYKKQKYAFYTFICTEELIIQNIRYTVVENINFFGIDREFIIQKLYGIVNNNKFLIPVVLKQISKPQLEDFNKIIKILKKFIKLYPFILNNETNSIKKREDTLCELCTKCEIKFHKINCCEKCFNKLKGNFTKHICIKCKYFIIDDDVNNHSCSKKLKKVKKLTIDSLDKYYNKMYGLLNEIKNTYILPIDYGYVITVHKSQGTSIHSTFIDYKNLIGVRDNRDLLRNIYVAISRTKENMTFFNTE